MSSESDSPQDPGKTQKLPEQIANTPKLTLISNQLESSSSGLLLSTQNPSQYARLTSEETNNGPIDVDETTPLLANEIQHESPSILYYRLRIFLYVLIVSIVIFPVIFHQLKDLSDLDQDVVNAVSSTLNSVSFLGFNDNGIESRASGSLHIDYSNADRKLHRYLLQLGAFFAGGSLVIHPTSPVQVSLRPADVQKFTKFANILVPPLEVTILQNSTTLFTLDTNSSLNSLASAWLGKYLFVDEAEFEVHAQFTADFETRLITIRNRPIDFVTTTTWKPSQPSFKVDQMQLEKVDKNIRLLAVAIIEFFKFPFNMALGDVITLVSLPDCLGEQVEIGKVLSKDVNLKPEVPLILNVTGEIGPISEKLVQDCSTSLDFDFMQNSLTARPKGSPIKQLVRSYLAGGNLQVYLQILDILLLPFWLNRWIASVRIPLSMHIPIPELEGQIVSNFSINQMDLQIDNGIIFLSSNVSISLDSKNRLLDEMQIISLGGEFEIFTDSQMILSGKTIRPAIVSGRQNLNLSLQIEVKIGDLEGLGIVISQLLRNVSVDTTMKLSRTFVEIDLPIYLGQLDELNFERNIELSLPSSRDLLYETSLQIGSISVVESTLNLITVDVEVQFEEIALPFFMEIPFDYISYEIKYSGSKVAVFKIKDLKEISSEFKFIATVTAYKTATNEIEDLISKYVSGYKGLQIDVVNGDVKVSGNPALSSVLLEIEVYNFTIPEISYSRGVSMDADFLIESSPFLVEATIFLLTSEVQLKIFNPVSNRNIDGLLNLAIAKYEGQILGTIGRAEMTITPGLYVLPRIPFVTNKGIGGDILRKALNNKLEIEITALFEVEVVGEDFGPLSLMYQGKGVLTGIRL